MGTEPLHRVASTGLRFEISVLAQLLHSESAVCCQFSCPLPALLPSILDASHCLPRAVVVPVEWGPKTFLDWYCSTVQGLLDWFELNLGFTELLFIQIDLCVNVLQFSTVSYSFVECRQHTSSTYDRQIVDIYAFCPWANVYIYIYIYLGDLVWPNAL